MAYIEELTIQTMSDEQLRSFRIKAEEVCGDMIYPTHGVDNVKFPISARLKEGFDALIALRQEISGEQHRRILLAQVEMVEAIGKNLLT